MEPAKKVSNRAWNWIAAAVIAVAIVLGAIAIWSVSDKGPERFVAVVGPKSGPGSDAGDQTTRGAQLSVDAFSRDNEGPKLGLVVFDDQNDPKLAVERAREIVADSRILLVIGHGTSSTSIAASPIYQEAGIAAMTGQATSDELAKNPSYFRTVFDNSSESMLLVAYMHDVLKINTISLIAGPGLYEQSLAGAVKTDISEKGTIKNVWQLSADGRDASIQAIVAGIEADPAAGTIVLALTERDAHDVLLAIRQKGLNPSMIGGESMGSNTFATSFASEPEEANTPGYFTEGLNSISPPIYDSISGDVLAFEDAYTNTYGSPPGWRSAKVYDAVTAGASAIQAGSTPGKKADIVNDRTLVAAQLHAINSPEVVLHGLMGPLFFDDHSNPPKLLHGEIRQRHPLQRAHAVSSCQQ